MGLAYRLFSGHLNRPWRHRYLEIRYQFMCFDELSVIPAYTDGNQWTSHPYRIDGGLYAYYALLIVAAATLYRWVMGKTGRLLTRYSGGPNILRG